MSHGRNWRQQAINDDRRVISEQIMDAQGAGDAAWESEPVLFEDAEDETEPDGPALERT